MTTLFILLSLLFFVEFIFFLIKRSIFPFQNEEFKKINAQIKNAHLKIVILVLVNAFWFGFFLFKISKDLMVSSGFLIGVLFTIFLYYFLSLDLARSLFFLYDENLRKKRIQFLGILVLTFCALFLFLIWILSSKILLKILFIICFVFGISFSNLFLKIENQLRCVHLTFNNKLRKSINQEIQSLKFFEKLSLIQSEFLKQINNFFNLFFGLGIIGFLNFGEKWSLLPLQFIFLLILLLMISFRIQKFLKYILILLVPYFFFLKLEETSLYWYYLVGFLFALFLSVLKRYLMRTKNSKSQIKIEKLVLLTFEKKRLKQILFYLISLILTIILILFSNHHLGSWYELGIALCGIFIFLGVKFLESEPKGWRGGEFIFQILIPSLWFWIFLTRQSFLTNLNFGISNLTAIYLTLCLYFVFTLFLMLGIENGKKTVVNFLSEKGDEVREAIFNSSLKELFLPAIFSVFSVFVIFYFLNFLPIPIFFLLILVLLPIFELYYFSLSFPNFLFSSLTCLIFQQFLIFSFFV